MPNKAPILRKTNGSVRAIDDIALYRQIFATGVFQPADNYAGLEASVTPVQLIGYNLPGVYYKFNIKIASGRGIVEGRDFKVEANELTTSFDFSQGGTSTRKRQHSTASDPVSRKNLNVHLWLTLNADKVNIDLNITPVSKPLANKPNLDTKKAIYLGYLTFNSSWQRTSSVLQDSGGFIDTWEEFFVFVSFSADPNRFSFVNGRGSTSDVQTNQNTQDIATNKQNIATNKQDITNIKNSGGAGGGNDPQTATNTQDIATIKTDLETNVADILDNDGRITTNKQDIATNKNNIATNANDIFNESGKITVNTRAIATNKTSIATNTQDITNLKAGGGGGGGAGADPQTATNTQDIDHNKTLINNETNKLKNVSNALGYTTDNRDINGFENGLNVKWWTGQNHLNNTFTKLIQNIANKITNEKLISYHSASLAPGVVGTSQVIETFISLYRRDQKKPALGWNVALDANNYTGYIVNLLIKKDAAANKINFYLYTENNSNAKSSRCFFVSWETNTNSFDNNSLNIQNKENEIDALLANSQPHLELDQIKARKGAGYDVVSLPTLLGGVGLRLKKLQEATNGLVPSDPSKPDGPREYRVVRFQHSASWKWKQGHNYYVVGLGGDSNGTIYKSCMFIDLGKWLTNPITDNTTNLAISTTNSEFPLNIIISNTLANKSAIWGLNSNIEKVIVYEII